MTGRHRWRTRLRELLPYRPPLWKFIPKGRDCSDHEWFRAEGTTWNCYHCRAEQRRG